MERLTVFRGANHSGKSSIEQAIEFLLAARSSSTGMNGQGADALIRQGAEKALVTAITADGATLRASLTPKSGRSFAMKAADGTTLSDLGWNRDVLSCCLNTRFFASLKAKDQKELLSSIVFPPRLDFAAEDRAMVEQAAIGVNWEMHPLNVLETVYGQAFERRREVNRAIKEWKAPELPDASVPEVEEVRRQLKLRQDELTVALAEQGERNAARENYRKERARLQERLLRADARHHEESRHLATAQDALLPDAKVSELEKLALGSGRGRQLDVQIPFLRTKVAEAQAAVKALEALEDAPTCPTCTQPITPEVYLSVLKPLADALSRAHGDLRSAEQERKGLGDFEAAERRLKAHQEARTHHRTIERQVRELEAELTRVRADLETLGDEPALDQTLDGKIAELRERIERGMSVHMRAATAATAREHYAKETAKHARLQEQAKLLETVVARFGPDGLRADLTLEFFGAFQDSINAVLGAWGYECLLSVEPYSFLVLTPGGRFALDQLSKSEQLRFGIAFQVALAIISGFALVVVDEADMLDDAGRKALLNALYREQRLEQIVLLLTDTSETAPAAPGSIFYSLSQVGEGTTATRVLAHTPARG